MTNQISLDTCLPIIEELSKEHNWELLPKEIKALAEAILPYIEQAPEKSNESIAVIALNYYMVDQMRTPGAKQHDHFWAEWRRYFVRVLAQKGLRGDAGEEIAQNACLEAFKSLPTFRFQSELESFFYTILSRSIIKWFKKNKKLLQHEVPLPDDDSTQEDDALPRHAPIASALVDAPQIVDILDCLERTLNEIGAKNPQILQVLSWYYAEGEFKDEMTGTLRKLTDEIIATRLGELPNNVRSWRSRALKQLKQCWE